MPRGRIAGRPRRLDGWDEIAVERLMSGDPPRFVRQQDRWEAIRRLVLAGHHDGQIAYLLGKHRTSITRTRRMLGIEPVISHRAGSNRATDCLVTTRPRALK